MFAILCVSSVSDTLKKKPWTFALYCCVMVLHVNLMKVSLTPFVAIFSCEACFTETFERVMFILCHAGASVLTRRRRTTTLQKEEKLVNTKINIVAQVVPYFN